MCSQLPFRTFGMSAARLHGRRALNGGVQTWNIPGSANLSCPIWTPHLCWPQGFPDRFRTIEDICWLELLEGMKIRWLEPRQNPTRLTRAVPNPGLAPCSFSLPCPRPVFGFFDAGRVFGLIDVSRLQVVFPIVRDEGVSQDDVHVEDSVQLSDPRRQNHGGRLGHAKRRGSMPRMSLSF